MAAAGAEARGGEGWRAASLTIPRSPGKLPRPGKRGRDPRTRQSATRRDAASRSADTLAPKGAPRASPIPRPLTLLAARPARSPQSSAPRFRGARPARPAPRSAVSRSADVPRTPWPDPRCPLGPRPLPAWSPCGGIRAAAAAPAWCVPCLVSLDTLQELCRKEKLTCKSIGITKRNLNNYEVEYLCDYKVVKVITSEEAERRGQLYDNKGITYLFDLDYESDEFTVDAARYGNVSHFVNHSCDPNLQVFNVFIDNLDTRLPRIALFSTRTINAGEELTFDYQMKGSGDVSSDSVDHSPAKKRVRTVCKCGAVTCRGYLN
uniref:Uncharacterized protein n=1 Tax=Felis catus TaxID=9685 RepID=A0ABI7XFJ4_FELCA